ncbi:glycosyltransferase family 2 protein [Paenibacillus gallinarum]|uniref:Glycosyltransferase family 2 protein n=1 Tax=Paenibacillus gallinarum TaxID=2762232 RepID=A0ABR8T1S1_9BACL|nr:glycosyltransferase family 2 protein [Paenibacillus gallinarum]MBD7969716.1 glycosyltransferase family 2 protein [Paenibacillus gallinarum]
MKKTFSKKGTISRKRKQKQGGSVAQPSNPAYQDGYRLGYEEGLNAGTVSYGNYMDGTSIVIPTFNQVAYLKECINSIKANTDVPYEIIVVDNASSDGTAAYLRNQKSGIRYTILEENRGFSGGINYGLMMARGKYIVMLNNDTVVTKGWLTHMLHCLQSDEQIAAVGPVTNYIGGDQQIDVPYQRIQDMWAFAERYSIPDPSQWRITDRLVGFCLLFRRELISEVGYLDEGYRIGNYEDEDWNIRIHLLNRKLAVAGDSFIHHYGSVSMKKLADQFVQTNDRNAKFYADKWGNPHDLVQSTKEILRTENTPEINKYAYHLYPNYRWIQSAAGSLYWLADGQKHRVSYGGEEADYHLFRKRAVTLSRPELRQIPTGVDITASSEQEVAGMMRLQNYTFGLPEGSIIAENSLNENSELFQLCQGKRRPFVTRYAAECWLNDTDIIHILSSQIIHTLPLGLPLIAPSVMYHSL